MSNSSPPISHAARVARAGHADRPIASALSLDPAHLEAIVQSHERCASIGLSRIAAPEFAPLGRADLKEVGERNRRLYAHAAPVMEMLFEQIVNTQSMVVLTDSCGTIIHSIGDDDFIERASRVALRPGANWAESSRGTNAIGTALVREAPTLVHADEHFMHANHFLTCSAAPILDPRGNILGVLDVTGDHRRYHQHTMGLVKMSARMIENHWLSDDSSEHLRLHLHGRPEFLGTLMEGILVVSRDGRVVGANRSALDHLGLSSVAVRKHTVTSLFATTVGELVDHFRSPLAPPLALTLPNGMRVHVDARFNWAAWHRVGEAPTTAPGADHSDTPRGDDGGTLLVDPGRQVPAGAGAMAQGASMRPGASAQANGHGGLASLDTGDARIRAAIEKLGRVVDRDMPILITGETGTGKGVVARAIHRQSRRARQPFVVASFASIPPALAETELFGTAETTTSGGIRRRGGVGLVVQAHGGTLFLDEVGDMPLNVQARLLRVLNERAVTPPGGGKPVPVDVSIVSATHRDLRAPMESGAFREDLYYRLNGLQVRLPPLRQRSDIDELVRRILAGECRAPHLGVDDEVAARLRAFRWPGNVRQLANVLRAAAVMAGGERLITLAHLPDDFVEETAPRAAPASSESSDGAEAHTAPGPVAGDTPHDKAAGLTLEQAELEMMRQAVEAANGNVSEAARRLGVARNTIYRKLKWKGKTAS
jgi:transcriptional regulator of acetoin/glycerol metabolism